MHVDFHPAALQEVENAQAWYEERSLLAASAFLRELSIAVQRIRQTPHRYPAGDAGTRRILLDTAVRRIGLDVAQIVPVHGKPLPWADFADRFKGGTK